MQADNLAGNMIVAYGRALGGTLSQAGVYPTGGLGGQLVGSVVDHTASQARWPTTRPTTCSTPSTPAATRSPASRFAAIALTRRQSVNSGGRFPVSSTVHGGQLYALTARDGGSIQGYAGGEGIAAS